MECQICGRQSGPDLKIEEELFMGLKGQQKSVNLCSECNTKARRNDPESMRKLLPILKE